MEEVMDWELDKPAPKERLETLKQLVDECWQTRKKIEQEQNLLKDRMKEVYDKEKIIKEILEDVKLESFMGTDSIYFIDEDPGIKCPETPEEEEQFRTWFKEKYPEAYEASFKMHKGSQKAFIKKELDIAAAKKEKLEIPGVPEPVPVKLIKSKAKPKKK